MALKRPERIPRQKPEYDQKVLDMRRVARVMAGGRRFSFRVTVVIGNRKGKVGMGTAKGQDMTLAVEKAVRQAKKRMITVPLRQGTIPHEVFAKFKSGKVFLKPTKPGSGVIAGGAVRVVCDFAGITHIVGKIMGKSSNQINNAIATLTALGQLKRTPASRGAPVPQPAQQEPEVPQKK
ncbi:MAG: 30S ribosomal protein S5 [Patescibacteria group bacterium]